ncbi:protein FAR1-RELATED SEQUENCE 6-like isoform X2 [Diospyros lotus]|nr:protein FAR1-RELATED SEQUENCE 6-like isoform X2 [Diospyros lotus]
MEGSSSVIEKNTDDGLQEVEEVSDVNVLTPIAGMVFNSEKEVFEFYNRYALQKGFGLTKRSTKNGDDGQLKYYSLACAKVGKYVSKAKNSYNPRPSMKTACKAKINVSVSSERKFTITRVYLDHNHQLSPGKSRFFKRNKNKDSSVKRKREENEQTEVPLCKNSHFIVEAGGYENLPVTGRDCRNYIAKAGQIRLGTGDAEALRNYFCRMQKRNCNFFYLIDMDGEGRLRNVFWADARSRAAYESFADVISFDTTYLTNKYDLPLTLFVGINHHGQTMLFGCGLLSNEDTETYIWLFSSWLECMGGRYPNAIVTDQCKAIQVAIERVFPCSQHRLCLWHIMRKLPEKLGGLSHYKAIKRTLKSVVYESIEVAEFEESWSRMIEEHNLDKNEWLNSLFTDRQQWVPVYVKSTFWAGMSTTQRSEGLNAFFDGYVGPKTSLKQFVEQYDNALKSKVEKETKADFASFHSSIPLITGCHFEKQFQEAYTNDTFKLFQDELRSMLFCNLVHLEDDGPISKFQVTDILRGKDGKPKRQVIYNVFVNEIDHELKCSCHLFEFKGILCRHVAKVLLEKNVAEVPPQCILMRWRKDVKRRYTLIENCYDDFGNNEQKLRYNTLCSHFHKAAEIGAQSSEKYVFLMKSVDEMIDKLISDINV